MLIASEGKKEIVTRKRGRQREREREGLRARENKIMF
jgi:hypothetical protein